MAEQIIDSDFEEEQLILFDVVADWKKHWRGMPEFELEDLQPYQSIAGNYFVDYSRDTNYATQSVMELKTNGGN